MWTGLSISFLLLYLWTTLRDVPQQDTGCSPSGRAKYQFLKRDYSDSPRGGVPG